jgi:hypothetical protein
MWPFSGIPTGLVFRASHQKFTGLDQNKLHSYTVFERFHGLLGMTIDGKAQNNHG